MQISSIARAVSTPDGKTMLEVAGRPFFELNSVAALIWAEMLDGSSAEQIVNCLQKRFKVPKQQLANDVNRFVELLKQNNLVKESVRTLDFHAELLWNKGIAALCDWRIPDEFPSGMGFSTVLDPVGHIAPPNLLNNLITHPEFYAEVQDGDLIWVRLSWVRSFLRQLLPHIQAKFVLITADSDVSVPTPIMGDALEILEYPNVLHWFAQNCEGPGFMRRLSPLPIGIDFHTLSERAEWGEDVLTPRQQEQMLQSVRKELRPLRERIKKIYVDFAWQPGHLYHPAKRQQVLAKILTNECFVFQSRALPRKELWRRWGEYAFVLSPHGVGLDCHRTWEALACGNIVLVPSSPLDCMYEGLPVIPVKDWKQVTPQKLDRWLDSYSSCEIGEEKLTSGYWVQKMRAAAREKLKLTNSSSHELRAL